MEKFYPGDRKSLHTFSFLFFFSVPSHHPYHLAQVVGPAVGPHHQSPVPVTPTGDLPGSGDQVIRLLKVQVQTWSSDRKCRHKSYL